MDYFAALPHSTAPLPPESQTKALAFHTDQLTPSAGPTVDKSQGVFTSIISWPAEAVLSPLSFSPRKPRPREVK